MKKSLLLIIAVISILIIFSMVLNSCGGCAGCGECYDIGWQLGCCMGIVDVGTGIDNCDTIFIPIRCDGECQKDFRDGLKNGRAHAYETYR